MPSASFSVAIASSFMIHRKVVSSISAGVGVFYVDGVFADEPVADPILSRPEGARLRGGRHQGPFELALLERKSVHQRWSNRKAVASCQRLDLVRVAKRRTHDDRLDAGRLVVPVE